MRRPKHNPNGFALLIVLVLVAMAGTMGISYLSAASVKMDSSSNMAESVRCRYLAEAGIEHGLHQLRTNPGGMPGSGSAAGPFQLDSTGDSYWFWGQATGTEGAYLITARGQVGSLTRELSATARVSGDYYDQMMELDPLGYWRMDDSYGSSCQDSTGDNHGSYENGPDLGVDGALTGADSTAVDFDGYNDYVDLGALDIGDGDDDDDDDDKGKGKGKDEGDDDDDNDDGGSDQMTLLAWVKWDGGGKGHIITKGENPSVNKQLWSLRTDSSGYLTFIVQTDSGGSTALDASTNPIQTGQWYMVAGVYNGSTMKLYLDGQEVASRSKSGTIATDDDRDAWIGGCPSNGKPQRWDGAIDEAAIFDKALTAEQLQALYGAQTPGLEMMSWDE